MGQASNKLKNRMKALALEKRNNPITGIENLSPKEKIMDYKAKIKQCEIDMLMLEGSTIIQRKINQYRIQIKELEKDL